MKAVVSIISRCGHSIEVHCKNQSIRLSYIALYKHFFHFDSRLKQLYICNKMEHFSYKGGMVYLGVHAWRCLKEQLAWAIHS